jgi:hypothetical protein
MRKGMIAALTFSVLLTVSATSALAAGAIAVNDGMGTAADEVGYGVGWGADQKAASDDAIKQCTEAGNDTCKVAVTFEQCGAYAGDRVHVGAGFGDTKEAAEKMALEKCPNCKVIVSECQ